MKDFIDKLFIESKIFFNFKCLIAFLSRALRMTNKIYIAKMLERILVLYLERFFDAVNYFLYIYFLIKIRRLNITTK